MGDAGSVGSCSQGCPRVSPALSGDILGTLGFSFVRVWGWEMAAARMQA